MFATEYSGFYIDGGWRAPTSDRTRLVISPTTEEVIGSVPVATPQDVDAAVAAARRAFDETDWASTTPEYRASLMESLAEKLYERRDEFAELLLDEYACTRSQADTYHVVAPTLHWNYNADMVRHFSFVELRKANLGAYAGGASGGLIMPFETEALVTQQPVGVVAGLLAYNFSLPGLAQKVAPAIAAGCTVVVKVPDPNPLALFAMGDLISEAGFPDGVINIIATDAESSTYLVEHPGVDMVSFTGSTNVGAQIGKACGELIRPAVLELGGKSAAVILEDADVEAILPGLLGASFITSSGQNCTCHSRFVVPRSRHDEIVAKIVTALGDLKVGDPRDPDVVMGPLVTSAHRDRVLGMIRRAVDAGAEIAYGGGVPAGLERGWFVEPTLLTNVTPDMDIAQEEVFGPVVAVLAYDTEDEAVEIANGTRYGLAGSVYTADIEYGFEFANRIRSGVFAVNSFGVDFNSPFGGVKNSGIGREHGLAGFQSYLQPRAVAIDLNGPYPHAAVKRAQRITEGFTSF